jgi:Protein of unknown function (DUF3616)
MPRDPAAAAQICSWSFSMTKSTKKSPRRHPRLADLPIAKPTRSAWLEFDRAEVGSDERLRDLRENLSAITIDGDEAWLASDEYCFVERLHANRGDAVYGRHRRFSLARPFGLSGKDAEVDLEGLSRDDNRLWVLGSHCLTRKKPDDDIGTAEAAFEALEAMQTKKRAKSRDRCLLGCLDLAALPAKGDRVATRGAAMVPFEDGSDLIDLLAEDDQLRPFLTLPAKDNGLDFEGLAVRGDAAFLGLRGPVLNGYALILELRLRVDAESGTISLRRIDGERRYAKHALELQGLGVRDLALRNDHLCILAAPTMPLDGIAAVFEMRLDGRWPAGGIVPMSEYRPCLRLPGGNRGDYAEGIACVGDEIAVVCDGPGKKRLRGSTAVRVDFYRLPSASTRAAKL